MKYYEVYQQVIKVAQSYCWMLLSIYSHEDNDKIDLIISFYTLGHKVIRRNYHDKLV